MTSECSKSVLKQEIAIICLTLEFSKSVLKQEIISLTSECSKCFKTRNYYCLTKSVLKHEIIFI